MKNKKEKKSKKKILIIIGAIVAVIAGLIIYGVVVDLNQEKKLKEELDYLYEITNKEDYDEKEVNKILNRTVTTGDYKKVEVAYKKYTKDCFTILTDITSVLENDRLSYVLTADNYQEDGKDFVKTKEYLKSAKETLEQSMIKYNDYFTEEKAMSYLDKELDDYYIDFYKDEVVGNLESDEEDEKLFDSLNSIIDLINAEEEVINFLIENKDNWQVENGSIAFTSDSLIDEYNMLLAAINNENI